MDACLRPLVSCRLITTNHQAEKGRYWRNRKNRKIQENVYVRIEYNSVRVYVCVDYICVFLCVVVIVNM